MLELLALGRLVLIAIIAVLAMKYGVRIVEWGWALFVPYAVESPRTCPFCDQTIVSGSLTNRFAICDACNYRLQEDERRRFDAVVKVGNKGLRSSAGPHVGR